jgi:hypothetical protein
MPSYLHQCNPKKEKRSTPSGLSHQLESKLSISGTAGNIQAEFEDWHFHQKPTQVPQPWHRLSSANIPFLEAIEQYSKRKNLSPL